MQQKRLKKEREGGQRLEDLNKLQLARGRSERAISRLETPAQRETLEDENVELTRGGSSQFKQRKSAGKNKEEGISPGPETGVGKVQTLKGRGSLTI